MGTSLSSHLVNCCIHNLQGDFLRYFYLDALYFTVIILKLTLIIIRDIDLF